LLKDKKMVVLGIPDVYEYMDEMLVALLNNLVTPHLDRRGQRFRVYWTDQAWFSEVWAMCFKSSSGARHGSLCERLYNSQ